MITYAERKRRIYLWRRENPERVKELGRQQREKHVAGHMWRNARRRAVVRNCAFTITVDDVQNIWTGRCAVSGLKLTVQAGKNGPLSPSLDRVKPELGYVRGNVRIVCLGYNMLKGAGTDAQARRIMRACLGR